jgi:hypothetical protein
MLFYLKSTLECKNIQFSTVYMLLAFVKGQKLSERMIKFALTKFCCWFILIIVAKPNIKYYMYSE